MALTAANIFKIITPIDVNFFNKFVKENQKISLTEVLAEQTQTQTGDSGPKNNVLQFKALPKDKRNPNKESSTKDSSVKIDQDQTTEGAATNDPYRSTQPLTSEPVPVQKKLIHSSTTYFLEEKVQGQYSQDLLKKKEILDLYTVCAKVDVYQERNRKTQMNESVDKGTLLNYKHS